MDNAEKVKSNLSRLAKLAKASDGLLVKVSSGKCSIKGQLDKKWHPVSLTKAGSVTVNGKTFAIDMAVDKPFNSFRAGLIASGLKGIKGRAENSINFD